METAMPDSFEDKWPLKKTAAVVLIASVVLWGAIGLTFLGVRFLFG